MKTIKIISSTNGVVTGEKEYEVSDEQCEKIHRFFTDLSLLKHNMFNKASDNRSVSDILTENGLK